MIDYHTHTTLSDGRNIHEEHIKQAMRKGIQEIGFTDHLTIKPVAWALNPNDYELMTENIHEMRSRYAGHIDVKFGLEVDYFPGRETEIREVIKQFPVDYVIGSVHFLGDWNYDTVKDNYDKWSADHLYRWYFETLKQAARSGLFDILGHADLIKKFEIYPESDQSLIMQEAVEVIKQNDLVVELNTSGPDRPCGEFFPSKPILEMCYKAGVKVTMGSDSHRLGQIGRYFEEGSALLKEIGYTEIATFTKRKRKMIALQ